MLKHKHIVFFFVVGLVVLVSIDYRTDLYWAVYVLWVLIFLSFEFYGAAFIQSGFHLDAICSIPGDKKVVLTFDDGPANTTEKVLDVLDEFGVKACFFCIGHRITGHEAVLKKINDRGHLIGNHSDSHSFFFDMKTTAAFI